MARIITVFSSKGGVGKTFVATNIAVTFGQKLGGKKVLLLDMDMDFPGDAATLLDLKPSKALVELFSHWTSGMYSPTQFNECITHHYASGVDFASFYIQKDENTPSYLDEKFISTILSDLSKQYDYIITDSGRSYNKLFFSYLGKANLILIVVNPDILAVSKVKETIKLLQSFFFPLNMIKIVLNRSESMGGVGWQEVMAALPTEILLRIPSDGKAVGSALNRRVPLVVDNRRCRAALAFDRFVDALLLRPEYFVVNAELEKQYEEGELVRVGMDFLIDSQPTNVNVPVQSDSKKDKSLSKEEEFDKLKQKIHKRIIGELELKRLYKLGSDLSKDKELREKTMVAITNAIAEETGIIISQEEDRKRIIKEIADEVLGLGPLEDFIGDPEISDIMVNNREQIYIEKHGKVIKTAKRFVSNEQIRRVIERIIAPIGRRIDESVPMVDARLADGSRVNAIIPPLSLSGPTLTIRKFFKGYLNISDLVNLGTLTTDMGEFIKMCVLARKNVIVSGGTGSGKTTILNLLSEFISSGERIITIEDAAELQLHHQHWIRLETRAPNIEGKGAVSIRDLFRNSLRMRPDRVIIGECRGEETLDMLQAMNTGHDGSMTTLHANSTQDVMSRLDSMILMSGVEIPMHAIREMIASAIDLIVHTARLSDGSRKITQISEVTGMLDETHIGLNDIFLFTQMGIETTGKILGEFRPTGVLPTFLKNLQERGFKIEESMFKRQQNV